MIDNIAVGKTIAQLRQNSGMTQQQLAAALNVSHQAVSKWENGAALPDIQTLMELTRLFGVTTEQLLYDDVPEDRLGREEKADTEEKPEEKAAEKPAGARTSSPFEDAIRDIGNFVNGIFRPAEKKEAPAPAPEEAPEDDGAEDPESCEPVVEAREQSEPDPVEEEPETEENEAQSDDFDIKKLLQMAPFMSKEAVEALLLEHKSRLSAADIARFAPFVSAECLEKLIQNAQDEINWDVLRRIAPFLTREVVDRLAQAAARGGKFVKDTAEQSGVNPDDIGKCIGDVSQKIGSGVESALRQAQKLGENMAAEVANAINGFVDGVTGSQSRADALRRAAYARALEDEKWDWLAAHIHEIKDEEILKQIAQKANGLGMHDWVLNNMEGYADTSAVDAAIEHGDWGWLGDHVWQFEDAIQEKIARAAAQRENWQWLSTYAEQISLENCADEIAIAAYKAEARVLASQIAEHCMNDAQLRALVAVVVEAEDTEFLKQLCDFLSPEAVGQIVLARAQAGHWDYAELFADDIDRPSVEKLMELAIAEGNFDAIDLMDSRL